jgi:DNA-binding CsgD family transcriptional regulator
MTSTDAPAASARTIRGAATSGARPGLMAAAAPALIGRARERQLLDGMLRRLRAGESSVLVIRGEAGIGKTALMRYCAGEADGCRVLQVAGVESEFEIPFAALHQLCSSMLQHLATLPEPQEQALRVAFGLTSGSTPDTFVVGLAVLSLLSAVAALKPLVCQIDDAQWLDRASSQVLAFIARRLHAEPVLLLFAVRETNDAPLLPGLPDLILAGLSDRDAKALLAANVAGPLDDQVRDRIVAETRGNPLGLIELPKGMGAAELAGGFGRPTPTTRAGSIQDLYLRRVRALPAASQRLMVLAAADPTGDAVLVRRAARAMGIGPDAVFAAEQDQLLEIGVRVRFRNPLVRSAAYSAATDQDRTDAHLALAMATDPLVDPEHRAWHRATAARAPDETIASDLERTAITAQERAGLAAAATFLERAAELSVDPRLKAERALAAAQTHLHAGTFDAAIALIAVAATNAVDDLQRARVELLTGQIGAAAGAGSQASLRLLESAARLDALDAPLARETYLQAWWAAVLAGTYAAPGGTVEAVSRAARSATRCTAPRVCDLLLDGLTTVFTEGRAAAAPPLRAAIDLFLTGTLSDSDWIRWGRSASTAAFTLWDVDSWIELSTRQVELARSSGALGPLVLALNLNSFMVTSRGELNTAAALVDEKTAVSEITGVRMASYGAPLLAAYRGRLEELETHIVTADTELASSGDGYALQVASHATAVLNNGLGRYAAALIAAREVAYDAVFLAPHALCELVEAAVRTNERVVAEDALERLVLHSLPDSDWSAGIVARARGLLSDGDAADHWYNESIMRLARTPLRPELARSRLVYGEWLRGEDRRAEARQQLRLAHDAFVEMGAEAFAERARCELVATGEKVRRATRETRTELTPQEAQIVELVRDGHTNPEIGAQLFLSARTVEWHLRKVFAKLGVTSRRELRDATSSES